jgi:AcrR family transcriptional regulator
MPRKEASARAVAPEPSRLRPRREPLQARARARLERILAATVELLTEDGIDALSTGAIAKRARVPIGSVYHYYPSKEAILAELANRTTARVDAAVARSLGRDLHKLPWRRAVERAVDAAVDAYRSDVAYVAVWRATRESPAFREVAAASDERFARALSELPLIRARLRPARIPIATRTAIRMGNSFLDWVLDTPDPRRAAPIVREMKRALTTYLAADFE